MAGVRIEGDRLPFATPEQIQEAALGAVRESAARSASRVKEILLTGRDARGFVGRKDTGLAHDAVGSSGPLPLSDRVAFVTAIGPPRDQIAIVLEEGRKPGAKMPPPDSLKPWIRRKLRNQVAAGMRGARVTAKDRARFEALEAKAKKRGGKGLGRGAGPRVSGVGKERLEKAADRLAFVIARSIGKRGTPGLHAFKRAAAIAEREIPGIYQRHLRRVLGAGKKAKP